MEKTECWWKWYTFAIFPIFGCPTAMKHRDRWHFKFRINSMNCNLQNFRNGCGVCSCRKKLFVFVGCRFIILFLLVIGWGNINDMPVECIVTHALNLFCMCFGYVPWSSNFGVTCFYSSCNIILVQFSLGVWGVLHEDIKRYESMHASHVLHMDTSLSPHFLLLFNGLKLKMQLFGILLRHWPFG